MPWSRTTGQRTMSSDYEDTMSDIEEEQELSPIGSGEGGGEGDDDEVSSGQYGSFFEMNGNLHTSHRPKFESRRIH